jgi:hypothetical protein
MMKRTILALILTFSLAYSPTTDAKPVKYFNSLYINNLQIIDLKTNQLANNLRIGDKYKLIVTVKNNAGDGGPFYANTQLRVVPPGFIQFYTNETFNQRMSRFDSPLFLLRYKQAKTFFIYFKSGVNGSSFGVKFNIGLYSHEQKITRKWHKLAHPK